MKKVKLTQEDIKHGVRGATNRCPIARALWRHFQDHYIRGYGNFKIAAVLFASSLF